MEEPFQHHPIRRCRIAHQPREGGFSHYAHNLWCDLKQNSLLITDIGLVSYRLAYEILQEPVLDAFVASGDAAMFIDPETGQHLYIYAGWV